VFAAKHGPLSWFLRGHFFLLLVAADVTSREYEEIAVCIAELKAALYSYFH
jgi:hypothetical protein